MVSLIIPSYKSNKTISYCLDSVLRQSFKDFECLIIDYPADNKTRTIVNYYQKKDKRFHYLKSPFKGAMAQREYGIKNANGNYICFLDSDDIIHPDYITTLYNNLINNEVDLSTCELQKINDISDLHYSNDTTSINIIKNINEYRSLVSDYRNNIGGPSPVCLLAKKQLFLDACKYYNNLLNIKYWEDSILSYYLYFNSSSICIAKGVPFYFYIKGIDITTKPVINIDSYFSDCLIVSKLLEIIIKNSLYPKLYKQSTIYSVFGAISFLLEKGLSKNEFNYVVKEIRKKINVKNIVIRNKEYSNSEKIIAFSLKYNCYLLAKVTISRLTKNKK